MRHEKSHDACFCACLREVLQIDLNPALLKHQRTKMDVSEESEEEAMFDGIALRLGFSKVLCTGTGGHRP